MGGQQSQPTSTNGGSEAPKSNGTRSHAGKSVYHDEDASSISSSTSTAAAGPCKPCFFMQNVKHLTNLSTKSSDPMGTPLPDTPLFQRKKRQQVQQALQNNNKEPPPVPPRFNYAGLEREASSFILPPQQQQQRNIIYEGPNADAELHAKYQLMEVVGVGSTSTVHRCIEKRTDQEFACKVIDIKVIEERFQGMMAQFQTEVEALKQLSHPGIIELYDVYIKTGETIYIVMEHMNGGELFDYVVQKGTLTEEEASQIVRKVTAALVHMHANNICHRDLKPENLLLKTKPASPNDPAQVKIIDFGLSKAMVDAPVARTFLGTRGYLAPEMLQRRDYTKAVDTWALGVIVFVLVCGCLPFDDDSSIVPSDDLVRAKFTLRFPRWATNLSDSAKDLLSHLLDVNPHTRYTAEQALSHPWVRGDTAPKKNMLASPGRIRASPAVRAGGKTTPAGRYGGRKQAPTPVVRTPPTPQGPLMGRKTSIP